MTLTVYSRNAGGQQKEGTKLMEKNDKTSFCVQQILNNCDTQVAYKIYEESRKVCNGQSPADVSVGLALLLNEFFMLAPGQAGKNMCVAFYAILMGMHDGLSFEDLHSRVGD